MTESQFIEKNSPQWKELESLLKKSDKDPDQLHELFIKVSSDLSYARTYFANRSVRIYLNNLTQEVFDSIRSKEKKPKFSGILTFFTETLPIEVYKARTTFYVALAIFLISALIGVVSTVNNEDFTRTIIGDAYVDMTEENIAKGDPMAVYKDEDMLGMTLGITFNNIRVAFLAFILGLLGGIGTIYIMVSNGIMLGTFQYFFVNKGLFLTSFLTIWIHGTIEISAIVIAGAAGLTLGSGILFPGTYPRTTSLQIAARSAMTIILGTVPLFIIAGLLESYVTRETGLPDAVRAGIIIISFLFIIAMWVLLPWRVSRSPMLQAKAISIPPVHIPPLEYEKHSVRTFRTNLNIAFTQFREYLSNQYVYIILPAIIIGSLIIWYQFATMQTSLYELSQSPLELFSWSGGGLVLFIFYWLVLSLAAILLSNYSMSSRQAIQDVLPFIKQHYWKFGLITLFWFTPLFFAGDWILLMLIVVLLLTPFIISAYDRIAEEEHFGEILKTSFGFNFKNISRFILPILLTVGIGSAVYLLTSSTVTMFLADFFTWHEVFDFKAMDNAFILHLLSMIGYMTFFPLLYFLFTNQYHSDICNRDASDLKERLKSFGEGSSILEKR